MDFWSALNDITALGKGESINFWQDYISLSPKNMAMRDGVGGVKLSKITTCYLSTTPVKKVSITKYWWTFQASFTTYVLSDPNNVLDANTAFVSLTLFNLLRIPLNILPMLIVFLVQCQVSVQRINKFMNAGELVNFPLTNWSGGI